MKSRSFVQFIPLSILTGTILYMLVLVITSNLIYDNKHHLGHIFTSVCICCALFKKEYEPLLTGFTLIAGTINLIAFTPSISWITFFNIPIQAYSFSILFLHILLNRKLIASAFAKVFS